MRLEDDRDFEMDTAGQRRTEDRLERRTKKRKKSIGLSILVMLGYFAVFVLVMIVAGWVITLVSERADQSEEELTAALGTDVTEEEQITLTQTELEEQIAAAEESVAVEKDAEIASLTEQQETEVTAASEAARTDLLSYIRSSLETGEDSVVEVLRPLYPDQLVVVSGGQFHFVDINDSLEKNDYTLDNLSILDTGEYQYLQDGQTISHKGIDVSSHQGKIDWEQVAADGVEFAFIRAVYRGYGTGKLVEDEMFETNVEGAQAAGIKVGVYVYSQAITEEELLEEANLVLEKVAPYELQCPIVYDVEKVSSDNKGRMDQITVEERTNLTALFCETVENAGYRSMIYHNLEMGALFLDLTALEEYDKWFAYYSDDMYYPYAYDIWQYTSKGTVAGISSEVDLNISFNAFWE